MKMCSFFFLSATLLMSTISCHKKEVREDQKLAAEPTLFDFEMFRDSISSDGIGVELLVPVFKDGSKVHDKINETIVSRLLQKLYGPFPSLQAATNPDTLMKRLKSTRPEETEIARIGLFISVSYQTRTFISLALTEHVRRKNQETWVYSYLNFASDGTLISGLEFFVNSPAKLESIAEHQFEKKIGTNINPYFEKGKFSLPPTLGFSRAGIHLPYDNRTLTVDTTFALVIPFMELKGIYKHKI